MVVQCSSICLPLCGEVLNHWMSLFIHALKLTSHTGCVLPEVVKNPSTDVVMDVWM